MQLNPIIVLICVMYVVRRVPATIIVGSTAFLVGLGSALDLDFLINQVGFKNLHTYAHTYVCTYVRMYILMFVCIHVCIYIGAMNIII